MGGANDGLRFLLELSGLAALAFWGFRVADGVLQWVLGLGAPLAFAVVWALFMAPRAASRTEDPVRLVLEVLLFGAACVALATADRPRLAVVLAAAVAVHLALTFALGQR
jgi:hypothetical protein